MIKSMQLITSYLRNSLYKLDIISGGNTPESDTYIYFPRDPPTREGKKRKGGKTIQDFQYFENCFMHT